MSAPSAATHNQKCPAAESQLPIDTASDTDNGSCVDVTKPSPACQGGCCRGGCGGGWGGRFAHMDDATRQEFFQHRMAFRKRFLIKCAAAVVVIVLLLCVLFKMHHHRHHHGHRRFDRETKHWIWNSALLLNAEAPSPALKTAGRCTVGFTGLPTEVVAQHKVAVRAEVITVEKKETTGEATAATASTSSSSVDLQSAVGSMSARIPSSVFASAAAAKADVRAVVVLQDAKGEPVFEKTLTISTSQCV